MHDAKQIKLLSDEVWGIELGMIEWLDDEQTWEDTYQKFGKYLLTVKRTETNYLGEPYEKIVGLLVFAFPKNSKYLAAHELIEHERNFSHVDTWTIDQTEICYLSEIIIQKKYRRTKVILELIEQAKAFLKQENIKYFYVTTVTDEGNNVAKLIKDKELVGQQEYRKLYRCVMQ